MTATVEAIDQATRVVTLKTPEGKLSQYEQTLRAIAEGLQLPVSQLYGVVTFYTQFRLTPIGKHLVRVCHGTACHVKGSAKALAMVMRVLKLQPGETSSCVGMVIARASATTSSKAVGDSCTT